VASMVVMQSSQAGIGLFSIGVYWEFSEGVW